MCDPPASNGESCTTAHGVQSSCITEENSQAPQEQQPDPSDSSLTNLEQHLLQRGPPGWGWLLCPPLQLVPVQKENGKDIIRTRELSLSTLLENAFTSLLILPMAAVLRAGQYQKGNQAVLMLGPIRFIQQLLYQRVSSAGKSAQAPSDRHAET